MISYYDEYTNLIYKGLKDTIVTDKKGFDLGIDIGFEIWANKVYEIKTVTRGLIFFCGNGASASMAEHMSHDWFQNAEINTTTCAEVSHITAISNDVGYDEVYSYRISRIISDHDMVVGISSSGNSPNIINAVNAGCNNGAFTITVTGKGKDNNLRKMADLNFYVPLDTYGEVESVHAVLLHAALDYYLDKYMGGRH